MKATDDYKSLHELDMKQLKAIAALAAGQTHEAAAKAAAVHRVTVTRWVLHHPAFIVELHRMKAEAAEEAIANISTVTRTAIELVASSISIGNVDSAFRWLRLGTLASVTTPPPEGPVDSTAVVEQIRIDMPSAADVFRDEHDYNARSVEEAEKLIASRIAPLDK
jgi:hypothetical protein